MISRNRAEHRRTGGGPPVIIDITDIEERVLALVGTHPRLATQAAAEPDVMPRSHSLRYFFTWMTPMPGVPQFEVVSYVDDTQIVQYDSDRKEVILRQRWVEERQGAEYRKWITHTARGQQQRMKVYSKDILTQTKQIDVAPAVSFTRPGDAKRLSCVATGFYPQAIEVTLWRDGVFLAETQSSGILPNHDGTFQVSKWTEFDPEDPGTFSCEVEHGGLQRKVIVFYVWQPVSQVPVVVGVVLGVLALLVILTIVAVVIYKKKAVQKTVYNPANTSDTRESSPTSSASLSDISPQSAGGVGERIGDGSFSSQ
uniref:major histocompatibility complex class I-related gene protein-like n=1 Tax=Pristiophorus japonicus TaxID=55135 RepID=UPI00398F2FEB